MKKIALLLSVFCLVFSAQAQDMTRPWAFWYWMYGAVSKPGIHADLQAMKDAGLGGCYLMPIRGTQEKPEFGGDAQQLTPRFWEMVDYAMQQADSLGLQLGIHICDGFALAGGPWITPEESMQKVVWSDTIAETGKDGEVALPLPAVADGYYEDIAVFAVPVWGEVALPRVSGTIRREANGVFRSKEAGYIQYDFDEPQTVRSLHIVPSGNNVQSQRLLVQTSDDGITYRNLRQLVPPRQGWQNTDENYTYSLPKTTSRHFRFCWTPDGTEPGSEDLDAAKWSPVLKLKELTLSSEPRIDQYESKNGSVWRIAVDSYPTYLNTAFEPVRLKVENGKAWLPVEMAAGGKVRVLRFGHTSTGHTNATAGGGKGLECDKFSVLSIEKQIDSWFGLFKKRPHSSVVKFMHVDSWECGSQNWSRHFAEEFQKRRGYDLLAYMPVFAGYPMKNYEQVLRDIRLTMNDLLQDVFFSTVARKAKDYGVRLSAESVAPTMVSDGMQHYRHADIPMGEFWLNSPTHDKPNDMLDAISGAHVYGKKYVQAEGFTEVRGVWDETPASIKALLDRNFALGMNRLFFHVFTHNPYTDKKPGMTLDGIGLFFQRDQTWFPEARALTDYIARCQQYLQRGLPVVDIAVFTGDEMPRRALTPDRLVPMLPGLFGRERVASEQRRMANVGQPMTESPVGVNHAAGILDLKDWLNPLHGYHYDSMNPDGLSRWLSKLYDPKDYDMPNYRVLVVPKGVKVSAESQQKIDSLKFYGISVITEPWQADTLPGVQPDAILPDGIVFSHRKSTNVHYYFLSNQTNSVQNFRAKLRVRDVTTLINPVTGELLNFDVEHDGDYTCIDITLPAYGSVIAACGLMFTDASSVSQRPETAMPIGEKLQWKIVFTENGEQVTTRQLFDWSQSGNDRIRYYSGRARYTTTFRMNKKDVQRLEWLQLPDVKDVAHVWLNGHDLGTVWTAPYTVPLKHHLRKGKNTLEIEVVNTWHNALRGADQGKAPFEGIWTNAKYRSKGDGLLPAGLLQTPLLLSDRYTFLKLFEELSK